MSIYEELGVKTYINAWDTISKIGGSRMSDETFDTMELASKNFVELAELQMKIGEDIAKRTHNEAAFITAGASSAILISACLLMTDCDYWVLKQLPDTTGLKSEIIMIAEQQTGYDKALEASGATVIRVSTGVDNAQALEDAITDKTAGIYFFDIYGMRDKSLSFETVAEIANRRNIPLIVDAAAQLPPISNLWYFTENGATAALFSGGKGICGPQGSGIIVGKKWLIDGFRILAAPRHGMGRSSKIGKEEICGCYAALCQYLEEGVVDAKIELFEQRTHKIMEALEETGLFTCTRLWPGPTGQTYARPGAHILGNYTAQELAKALEDGEPGIIIGVSGEKDFFINPLNLKDEEVDVVLRETIACARKLNG